MGEIIARSHVVGVGLGSVAQPVVQFQRCQTVLRSKSVNAVQNIASPLTCRTLGRRGQGQHPIVVKRGSDVFATSPCGGVTDGGVIDPGLAPFAVQGQASAIGLGHPTVDQLYARRNPDSDFLGRLAIRIAGVAKSCFQRVAIGATGVDIITSDHIAGVVAGHRRQTDLHIQGWRAMLGAIEINSPQRRYGSLPSCRNVRSLYARNQQAPK